MSSLHVEKTTDRNEHIAISLQRIPPLVRNNREILSLTGFGCAKLPSIEICGPLPGLHHLLSDAVLQGNRSLFHYIELSSDEYRRR